MQTCRGVVDQRLSVGTFTIPLTRIAAVDRAADTVISIQRCSSLTVEHRVAGLDPVQTSESSHRLSVGTFAHTGYGIAAVDGAADSIIGLSGVPA